MAAIDLQNATIADLSRLIKSRKVSPVELIQATLKRIDSISPRLNAFTTVTADHALKQARQAEKEIAQGRYRGPLHGIPYTLKDLIDTEGIRTTYGYQSHQDFIPQRSATVHTRLQEAGAVLVGKVDCHFRRRVPVKCHNPWDTTRTPGISSSGSGASLAASLCLASLGSDTGGSVRIPAAWCGVVGLKATFGLISRHNAFGPAWSLDQIGPMARTAKDTAIVLQAIAGFDPDDPVSLQEPVPDYLKGINSGIKGLRVGILEEFLGQDCHEEVEAAVRKAVAVLQRLGASVQTATIPHAREAKDVSSIVSSVESAISFTEEFPKERLDKIDPDVKQSLERGRGYSIQQYLQAQRMAAIIRQETIRALKDVDVLVAPTCQTPPPLIPKAFDPVTVKGRQFDPWPLLLLVNTIPSVAGLPALSVPCGFTKGPLPVGLHLIGRPLEERLLLRVAHSYQQATDWHQQHPQV